MAGMNIIQGSAALLYLKSGNVYSGTFTEGVY